MQLEVISHVETVTRPNPILFVHGAWHAAWCWENFLPYFAERGYASYAVSLRGHGASEGRNGIRWHSASRGYVADLAQVARTLDKPPILVGHSMGGYVVQKYLETHSAKAAILLATIPASGIFNFVMRYAGRHPWKFLKSLLFLNPWHMVETPALTHESFFSPKVTAEENLRHFARLQSESFKMVLETMVLDLPRPEKVNTPMQVFAAANDRVFSIEEQQSTARAYGIDAELFHDMAHDMMLEPNWRQVADRIRNWLQEREL